MAQNRTLRGRHHTVLVIERHGIMRIHAGFVRSHRRFNASDWRIMHDHVDEIDRIYANIQQCATGKRGISDSRLRGGGVTQVRIDRLYFTNRTGGENLIDNGAGRHVSRPNRFRAQHAGFFCNG